MFGSSGGYTETACTKQDSDSAVPRADCKKDWLNPHICPPPDIPKENFKQASKVHSADQLAESSNKGLRNP
jgi:hypothetical protein